MRCPTSDSWELSSDLELVRSAQMGEQAALEILLRRNEARMRAAAKRLASNDGDAEEILQDTMLQVVRTLHQFRGECSFLTWASAVARSQAHRQRRKRVREWARRDAMAAVMHGCPTYLCSGSSDPEQETSDAEFRTSIRTALEALNPLDRRVFALRQLQGLSAPAVAKALDLSVPAVKSRLHRARRELRLRLAPLLQESVGTQARPGALAPVA